MLFFGLPVSTSVLLPLEIVTRLAGLRSVDLSDGIGKITLMHLNGNESFDLGTVEFVEGTIETHGRKFVESLDNFFGLSV